MKEERARSSPLLPLMIAALVMVLMAVYVTGYFALDCATWRVSGCVIRDYQGDWLAEIYRPAGRVEEALSGCDVYILTDKEYLITDKEPGDVKSE